MTEEVCTYLIMGGGIAGVSCAQQLSFEEPAADVVLVSAVGVVRQASAVQVTRLAHQLHVTDVTGRRLAELYPNVRLRQGTAARLDARDKVMYLSDGGAVRYDRLCVCTGARPRLPLPPHPAVITIRDDQSVAQLLDRLGSARRVLIVGNGGIASELVFSLQQLEVVWAVWAVRDGSISSTFARFSLQQLEVVWTVWAVRDGSISSTFARFALQQVEVVWAVRDGSISSTFVDAGAAEFLLPQLKKTPAGREPTVGAPGPRRWRYHASDLLGGGERTAGVPGSALGPDWLQQLEARGGGERRVSVRYHTELRRLVEPPGDQTAPAEDQWPVYAELINGETLGCDFVVAATGVVPNSEPFTQDTDVRVSPDGGLLVDDHMRTHQPSVYAAGDVCTPDWELAPHWFQMRLWSQARQMGLYAGRCMSADRLQQPLLQDFCFEMFAHVTRLLGHKLILLGLYNGQRLGTDYSALVRMTPGVEFIKVVLRHGRVQGALLLGDTELEETFENLILSQMDVSHLGDDLLAPDVDIDDYFD